MRRALAASLVCAIAACWFGAAACGSVPDVTFGDGGSSTNPPPPPPTDGPSGDSPMDSGPPCTPTGPEICDDGIDNDCKNGTDCADPACFAFQCQPATPSGGWTPVAFSSSSPTTCPSGWGAETDVKYVLGDGTDGSCACTCDGSGGTVTKCDQAGATYTLATFAGSATCGGAATNTPVTSKTAMCVMFGAPLPFASSDSAQITAPNGPATCAPNVVLTKSNITPGGTCAAPTKLGAGCAGTSVCAPKTAALKYCVMKSGLNACPAPFTVRRRAGTDAMDPRACNTCTCTNPPAPCSGTVTVYTNGNCTAGAQPLTTAGGTGTCMAGSGMNTMIKGYQATVSGGCAPPSGFNTAITGGVATFTGDETICCTN